MNRTHPIIVCVGVALVVACRAPASTSVTETTSARLVGTYAAEEEIADAICKRELACTKFGVETKYSDFESCTHVQSHSDLRAEPCPRGVALEDLDRCVREIRSRPCHKTITRIETVELCERRHLCARE